ncbi:MAG: hypothetical protein APR63_13395 [Desulfuromonas sp. SDB]|nr:MAG: hypothetical protein APR63_13395 [Desulfuromonas sp. SDB]
MKKIIVIITILIIFNNLTASEKSARTAMLASLLIPGGGQFYTGRTTRGLIISVIQGTLLTSTIYSHFKYRYYDQRYDLTANPDDSLRARGFYDMRNDLLWWDALVITISVADAYVGAKMYGFYEKAPNGENRINIGIEYNW